MADNKSHAQSRDGVAISRFTTGDNNQLNIVNKPITYNIYDKEQNRKTLGNLFMLVIFIIIGGFTALSRSLQHDPGVEKWMDMSTTRHVRSRCQKRIRQINQRAKVFSKRI